MSSEVCVNCEEPIGHTPVFFDGEAYCCVGCVAGGPCLCTYSDQPTPVLPTLDAASGSIPPSASRAPAASAAAGLSTQTPPAQPSQTAKRAASAGSAVPAAPGAAASPQTRSSAEPSAPESRDPIPFRRPGNVAVVVQAIGFAGQRDLLAFAALVEGEPTFAEVSLTRVTPTEAWFALRTSSPESAASAIRQFAGFRVDTFVDQNVVEVRIASVLGAQGVRLGEPPHPAESAEPLLPPRPRFRVFRPGPNDAQLTPPGQLPQVPAPQAPPRTPTPPQPPAAAAPTPPRAPDVPPTPAAPPSHVPQQAPTPADRPAAQNPPAAPSIPARPPVVPTDIPRIEARPVGPTPAVPVPRSTEPRSEPERPAPVQPAAFAQGEGDGGVVNPDARPGGAVLTVEHMTLVAYPFHSFAALNDFQGAIRKLHGVTNTRVRRFYRGTLHLAVDYEDMIPLSERLRDLKGFNFEVASESRSEIELVLEDSGTLVAAGEN